MATTTEDAIEGELVDPGTALATLNKSELDMQITTAKQYPRSLTQFKQDVLEMTTLDEETAAGMFYVIPRDGKKIEGPSVRLAEVVASSWGNLRCGARIVGIDEKTVTAQGFCFDLQKNVAASIEISRRITGKKGRFSDDMIQVTANAAKSIALREAIFKVVPRAMFKEAYEQAKLTSIGKASSMSEKRHGAMDWFKKAGASERQVLDFLGHKGIDDITVEDLITLRGLVTAIKDGELTIESALAVDSDSGSKVKTSPLNEKLKTEQKPVEQPPADNPDLEIELTQLAEAGGCPADALAGVIEIAMGMGAAGADYLRTRPWDKQPAKGGKKQQSIV